MMIHETRLRLARRQEASIRVVEVLTSSTSRTGTQRLVG
jgi:hypothetical protein